MTVARKNQVLLDWLRAAGIAVMTFAATTGHVDPAWAPAVLALAAGVLTLLALDLGMLAALLALSLPIIATNALIGVVFLILSIVSLRYLGGNGGLVFFLIGSAVASSFLSPVFPVWIAVGVAGILMGAGEGAITAALACVAIQAAGLLGGHSVLGPTVTGGSDATALLDLSKSTASLVSFKWVAATFGTVNPTMVNGTIDAFAKSSAGLALVVQPVLWAAGAAVAGMLSAGSAFKSGPLRWAVVPAAGIAVTAVGIVLAAGSLGTNLATGTVVFAALSSAVVAVGSIWALDTVFVRPQPQRIATARPLSMAAEDADVDELLRLIATAEDKLTSEHTTQRTVLITDMKSFSRMTEEDGSMLSAKAVQKHRDLLLPVIHRLGGHGKSTGGDGLVAAFEDPASAILAAAEMQRAIAAHNDNHPDEREMSVRVGIADGEVVLDRGGRPFIGSALNLAARVMNLADGGQVFATGSVVAAAAAAVHTHAHGPFELKNIAKPVEVVEILWAENQQPEDPRTRTVA